MELKGAAVRLRIYISSTDKLEHNLLSEHIVQLARKNDLAGATVLKGIIGYGSSSVIHSYKLWEMDEKVPVVLEIIDLKEQIDSFLNIIMPILETMQYGCLVTSENIDVLLYKPGKGRSQS